MNEPRAEQCGNCRFAFLAKQMLMPPNLRCRRYPRQWHSLCDCSFPETNEVDWCGEWQPMREGEKLAEGKG